MLIEGFLVLFCIYLWATDKEKNNGEPTTKDPHYQGLFFPNRIQNISLIYF